ncbi:MAG: hypothetical protein N3A01_04345 [Bacteroidales bacterium]|nr:hypothetical protein [Bacteroidales bacterium]
MRKKELKKFSFVFVMSGQKGFHIGFHLVIELSQFLNKFNAALVWLGASKGYGLNFYVEKAKTNLKIDNLILPGILRGEEYYSWLNVPMSFY